MYNEVKKRSNELGSVYFIRFGDLYKIGKTKSTARRFSDIKFSNPFAVLHKSIDVMGYHYAESFFHNLFLSHKVHGEWFKLKSEDIDRGINELLEQGFDVKSINTYPDKGLVRNHFLEEELKILDGVNRSLRYENWLLREVVKEYDKLFKRNCQ